MRSGVLVTPAGPEAGARRPLGLHNGAKGLDRSFKYARLATGCYQRLTLILIRLRRWWTADAPVAIRQNAQALGRRRSPGAEAHVVLPAQFEQVAPAVEDQFLGLVEGAELPLVLEQGLAPGVEPQVADGGGGLRRLATRQPGALAFVDTVAAQRQQIECGRKGHRLPPDGSWLNTRYCPPAMAPKEQLGLDVVSTIPSVRFLV